MNEPALWTGMAILAGTLAAMVARAARLPAASGALAGGFILILLLRSGDPARTLPGFGSFHLLALVLLCFLLGAELDLARLARARGSLLAGAALQSAGVLVLICAAGAALGMGWRSALALGAAAIPTSPVAVIAVSSEARARGAFTERILALSALTTLLATIAVGLVTALVMQEGLSPGLPGITGLASLLGAAFALAAGGICGALVLIPLSRMATQAGVLACLGVAGILMLGALRTFSVGADPAIASVVAGFTVVSLAPNRELIREALRGAAPACAIVLFASAGTMVAPVELSASLLPALAVVAARFAAVFLAGLTGAAPGVALRGAVAQVPCAGVVSVLPAALFLAGAPRAFAILSAVIPLSEAGGMIATRWALQRSGEASPTPDDPDAWRARMR